VSAPPAPRPSQSHASASSAFSPRNCSVLHLPIATPPGRRTLARLHLRRHPRAWLERRRPTPPTPLRPGAARSPPLSPSALAAAPPRSRSERSGRRPVAVQRQSPPRLSIGACPSALRRIPPRPSCPSDSTAAAVRLGPARRASPPRLARRRPVSPACRAFSALERFLTYELLRPRPSCGSPRGRICSGSRPSPSAPHQVSIT